MRKKFYMAVIVALIVTTAGYNMYSAYRTTKLSDLALANVEALAYGEWPSETCYYNPYTTMCVQWGTGIACYCNM